MLIVIDSETMDKIQDLIKATRQAGEVYDRCSSRIHGTDPDLRQQALMEYAEARGFVNGKCSMAEIYLQHLPPQDAVEKLNYGCAAGTIAEVLAGVDRVLGTKLDS